MAKKKKEEIVEEVQKESKDLKATDIAAGEDQTVETYNRVTPFGIEVWDPKTKSTTMKSHG